jgi:integrase
MSKAANLETREQRAKLKSRHEPYWRQVQRGLAIGYRKASGPPAWYVREHRPQGYVKRTLALADDTAQADGKTVLSWEQVLRLALEAPPETLPTTRGGLTVSDLAKEYFKARRVASRSQLSADLDAGKIKAAVVPVLGEYRINDLRTADLRAWRDGLVSAALEGFEGSDDERREKQRKAQATANRTWSVFRAMLNWAFREGLANSDTAWRQVKPFRDVDRPRLRTLTVPECRRLLNACPPRFRPLVRAALLSGLRYGELARLRVRDYSHDGLTVANGKGRTKRTPLTREGVEYFDALTAGKLADEIVFTKDDGEPWGYQDQKGRMARACKRAKIAPAASFHDLRRTYGSLLINAKAPIAVISEALRHSDTRMTQRAYAHLLEKTVRTELQKALPRIGPKAKSRVTSIDRTKRKGA